VRPPEAAKASARSLNAKRLSNPSRDGFGCGTAVRRKSLPGIQARPRGVVIPFATLTKKALSSLSKRRTTACRAERGAQARETVGGRSTLGRRSARSSAVGLRWAAR
jgi:hypothetical protein